MIYTLTAAPTVTWWDAGEFIAAVHTLGIPHPPGTPLYILLAHAWATVVPGLDSAAAVNLFSALCTAAAAGLTASLITRASGRIAWGVGAALCAGTMSTVWLSATEAEVYATSLLLAVATLAVAEWTGRTGDRRGLALVAYLFGLAVPLHATALVAGPAACWLGGSGSERNRRWWIAALIAAFVAAAALATGRWVAGIAALGLLAAIGMASRRWAGLERVSPALPLVILLGASAVLFLVARAPHDPGINQGNPETIGAMLSMIARDQYDIPGLWPRQAPIWIQVANLLEYVDWQAALGVASDVLPSISRTLFTLAFLAIGAIGSAAHRRRNRRGWMALAVLCASASLGVVAYLNLRAGPSIGYGILPDDAPHEPRERDYFFALAFWTWGVWAGIGAVDLAERRLARLGRFATMAGIALAALPMMLNWRAVNRRGEPERSLPERFATELLEAAPPGALLVVAGDNDTYPLWFAQQVLGIRRDVVVLTYPLIGADWYRAELHRRWGLGSPPPHERWRGMATEAETLAASAREQGRPVTVAVTVDRGARQRFGQGWRLTGLVYVESPASPSPTGGTAGEADPVIDVTAARVAAERVASLVGARLRPSTDPTGRFMVESLRCPSAAIRMADGGDATAAAELDSACNYR